MRNNTLNIYFVFLNLLIFTSSVFLFPNYQKISSGLSLQFLSIGLYLGTFILIEILVYSKMVKTLLGGCFLTFSFFYFLDSFSLHRGSNHFLDFVRIAFLGGDILTTLREVGISPGFGFVLLLVPISIFFSSAWVYKKTDRKSIFIKSQLKLAALFLLTPLTAAFVGEQTLNQKAVSYLLRERSLPLYFQVYSTPWEKFDFSKSPTDKNINAILGGASKPSNPKNIVLIILEGVPSNAIDSIATPFLNSFAKKAHFFSNSMTEAIATHLALNSLLFNRPAYSFENDIKALTFQQSAALPFEIYKQAGYEIYLGVSTDFSMKSDEARALGLKKTVDHYFKGFKGTYVGRNITDNLTTNQAIQWIQNQSNSRPFIMTLQLDCTHWPYEFDKENIKFTPYLLADRLDKFDSVDLTELVLNRYKNALRQLDMNIEKIITALQKKEIEDDTAVAIISDHGENFKKGFVTHLNLSEDSKKIANFIYIPGRKLPENTGFITHRDIWPTFLDYTGIHFENGQNPFHGISLLKEQNPRKALFTINGNLRLAELSYADKVIHFSARVVEHSLYLAPYLVTNKAGEPLANWQVEVDKTNWVSDVKSLIY